MALVSNGTNQYSLHTLTTLINTSNAFTIAFTFRTGAVVSGVLQVPLHINRASSYARGFGLEISSAGAIRGFSETGSRNYTTSLGTATANTVYTVVMTKDATGTGPANFYVNTISNTASRANTLTVDLTRIISGAIYSSGYGEYFGGKLGRIAFWPSKLSNPDITICLDNTQTPAACSVTPQDYWIAISNDTATYGSNATVRTGTTYDSDTLSAATIDTITDPIEAGGNLSFTATGVGTVTSITTNIAAITVGSITGTGASGGATISGWVDGSPYPDLPAAIIFTFADGVVVPTKASNVSMPSGFVRQQFTEWTVDDPSYLGNLFDADGFDVIGSQFFYTPYSDLVIGEDTKIDVSGAGTIIGWLRPSTGTGAGNVYYYSISVSAGGAVIGGGGLTTRGLTVSGPTVRGLTVTGL